MKRFKIMILPFFLAGLMLAVSWNPAMAKDYSNRSTVSGAGMIVDFFVARPLGLCSTLGGSAMFIVSLPFSALGHNVDEAAEHLVMRPLRYTFKRPLGEF